MKVILVNDAAIDCSEVGFGDQMVVFKRGASIIGTSPYEYIRKIKQ